MSPLLLVGFVFILFILILIGISFSGISFSVYQQGKTKKRDSKLSPLYPCPDCGHQVSRKANQCPNCGRKVSQNWSTSTMIGLGILSLAIPIVGIIIGIVGVFQDGKRGQGAALILLSFVGFGINFVLLSSL